jgi:ABC-2 type transport system permease protein
MISFRKLLRTNMVAFRRDGATVFWTFAFPLLFIVIFGAIYGGNSSPNFDVGLAVRSDSAAADALRGALQHAKAFKLHEGTRDAEIKKLKDGDLRAVIVVGAATGGGPAPVQVFSDPAQTSTQQVVVPLLQQLIGVVNASLANAQPALQFQQESIGTRDLRGIDYLVPGILAMALMQLGLFSAIPLMTQRENKVLRRLAATPLPRRTFVSAQVSQRLVIAVLQAIVLLGAGRLLFGLRTSGTAAAMAFFIVLGALMFVAMGYLVSGFAKTAESAQPLVGAIQFPMLFLSGIFFPIEAAPGFLQSIARFFPLTYLGDALRQVAVNASPLNPLWLDTLVMLGWLAVCMAGAVRFFRWE